MFNSNSGTRISVRDTSIQDGVDRVNLPVNSGLAQALFFTAGGDGKNYAPDGTVLPNFSGSPFPNAFSKSFPSINDYVNTNLTDSSDFTVMLVNRPSALTSGKQYRPMFGNWDAGKGEPGKGAGLGVGLIQTPDDGLTLVASSIPVADANNPSATTSVRENETIYGLGYSAATWRFSVYRVSNTSSYFKDFTKNVFREEKQFKSGNVKDNRRTLPLLVSGQYGNDATVCEPGPEAVLMLFYRRALSDAELATMYAWAKKYCARRGITV